MLCEISQQYGPGAVWLTLSILGAFATIGLSGSVFLPYYAYPTYEKWTRKSNPKYPTPAFVRKEIIQSLKGVAIGVICPAFALWASSHGMSKGYCGDPHNVGILGHVGQTLIIIGFTDFTEYAYHWLGHRYHSMWDIHKHHHVFYNPTPFAVIADELVDQFMRSLPMVFLPALLPINIDLLFGIFATLFYGYGVYLHWGYESPLLSAHNPIFNTSYHHYSHHVRHPK
jgi:Delta7-sterol 5-desaturase